MSEVPGHYPDEFNDGGAEIDLFRVHMCEILKYLGQDESPPPTVEKLLGRLSTAARLHLERHPEGHEISVDGPDYLFENGD